MARRKIYSTTLVDSPWPEKGGGGRGAQNHYDVLPVREIPGVILAAPNWNPAPNAHLYFWTTNTFLPAALAILPILGFRYVTMVTWGKTRPSLGQYFRGRTEHMLFGVRGRGYAVRTELKNLDTLMLAPSSRIHSRKPESAHDLIEKRSYGPYAELFARRPRPGWTCWGNQL
jgi:N6-adenosine-specific RNA methylase IME4